MQHPFKIGETFENRFGAYTVLSITPPHMQIQYENGKTDTVTIAIQARIWRRKQDEREVARAERRKKARAPRGRISFSGLKETDFKDNVVGTNWRSSNSLGGLIAQRLSDRSSIEFVSTAIPRQPRIFLGPPSLTFGKRRDRVKLPKFEVHLDDERLRYSFHIEKPNHSLNAGWYWPRFLDLLTGSARRQKLAKVMQEHDLAWLLRYKEGLDAAGRPLPADRVEFSTFGEGRPFATFSDFLAHLQNLPTRQWCNLYIARYMPKSQAIDHGVKVGDPITQTFNALTPILQPIFS